MNTEQRNRLEQKIITIAKRLGRAAGDADVDDEGCAGVGLMGDYERRHFGLADFEEEFSMRLGVTVERLGLDRRTRDMFKEAAWIAWVVARNARVRERCPKAREYGDEG